MGMLCVDSKAPRQISPAARASPSSATSGRAPTWLMISAAHRLPSEPQAVRQTVEKAGGVQIAGAGGVDDMLDRRRCDVVCRTVGEDEAAIGATGQCRDPDMAAHRGGGGGKILGLVERADFGFVGEQDVDVPGDQFAKGGAVAIDAERVG